MTQITYDQSGSGFRELHNASEDRQQQSLLLSESISAANLRFIETGSINQMAQILIESCMTVTSSPFGMLYEMQADGNANIIAVSLTSSDPASRESLFNDISYEIRRHGGYLLPRHPSLLLAPVLEHALIIADSPDDNRWADCACQFCIPRFTAFAGLPLNVGNVTVGGLILANRSSGYRSAGMQDIDSFAQTCALALNSARADIERKVAQEQLRHAQKMEAIGQLAGGIAHDFNNLLTVINGYSSLVLQKTSDTDPIRKDVEQILNAGERAATLVRQLLAFGRRQMLEPRLLNINSLIASLHIILCRLIGENITLSTRLDPVVGQIKADPSQIEQIIMNLVINARDAFSHGGTITIETSNVDIGQEFVKENRGAIPGSYVRITVMDTGMGMSESCIKRIFEPFFTTKEQGKGTGLGLATVYGIVKQNGGYIQVVSELGIGSEFRVFLPRTATQEKEIPRSAFQDLTTRPSDSSMILIVEDEKAVLDLTALTLRSKGHSILTATTPLEALKIFDQYSKHISLLITDVVMPDMTGPEMVKIMRHTRPDLPLIFMSGYADGSIDPLDFIGEEIPFLLKPFDPAEMARVVSSCLIRRGPIAVEDLHA